MSESVRDKNIKSCLYFILKTFLSLMKKILFLYWMTLSPLRYHSYPTSLVSFSGS